MKALRMSLLLVSSVLGLILCTSWALAASSSTQQVGLTSSTGWDIFDGQISGGYRYGPSFIVNEDSSIDMWTCSPGANGAWDFIRYSRSEDNGVTWTGDQAVLQPSPNTMDSFSTCDPGVIKFGGYYYIGYTSTTNTGGTNGQIFVARSENPDGPWEKWNGSGWGGNPKPFIVYDGYPNVYGSGEPSFVVKDGTLYVYYAWIDLGVIETRVSTVSAADENWPANLVYQGVALNHDNREDSTDVKYVDSLGKFVAFHFENMLLGSSYPKLFESTDGIHFTQSYFMNGDALIHSHNGGLSGDALGHINTANFNFIGHAYGPNWANWQTRLSPISLTALNSGQFSDDFSAGSANWTANSGSWSVVGGAYSQSNLVSAGAYSTIGNYAFGNATYEVDLKITDAADSGKWAGINFAKTGAGDTNTSGYLAFLRENGYVGLYKAGVGQVSLDVATGTDPTAGFVHMKVVKGGNEIKVYVGDTGSPQIVWVEDGIVAESGYVSLGTNQAAALFDNVSIYNNISENFSAGSANWTANAGTWSSASNAYSQTNTTANPGFSTLNHTVFGDALYEADVKINSTADPGNWVGINIAKTSAADFYYTSGYLIFLRGDGTVSLFKGGAGGGLMVGDVPTGTNPLAEYVHLAVYKTQNAIQVFVGNASTPQIYWLDNNSSIFNSGYMSLVNVNGNVSFKNVSIDTQKIPGGTATPGPSKLPNLARLKTVTSNSSLELSDWGLTRLTDGIESSPITSGGYSSHAFSSDDISSTPVWIDIDLGANRTFSQLKIYPRMFTPAVGGAPLTPNFPVDFTIQTAPDGGSYSTALTVTAQGNPVGGPQVYNFLTTTARHIRVQVTKLGLPAFDDPSHYYVQIAEMEVFLHNNFALFKSVTSNDSLETANIGAARLTDGIEISPPASAGYSSNDYPAADISATPVWVDIDLGSNKTIKNVSLFPRTDIGGVLGFGTSAGFPVDFIIESAPDGGSYSTLLTVSGQLNPSGGSQGFSFPITTARHVRITVTKLGDPAANEPGNYRLQLAEMKVQ